MLGWLLLLIGIIGFGLAGYLDLKTTEFPDWLPYSMITSAIGLRLIFTYLSGDTSIIINSLIVGCVFLGLGLLLYFTKQWGDGDAWLLGALGFLFPEPTGFSPRVYFSFPIDTLFNFFFIGFLYILIYSIVLGIKSKDISKEFIKNLKKDYKGMLVLFAIIMTFSVVMSVYMLIALKTNIYIIQPLLFLPFLYLLMVVFLRYGRFIEKKLFRKRIHVKYLRVGDVLADDRWRGLTEDDVRRLKRKGGYVWIKEGVRFAAVFLPTLIISLLYGCLIYLFL